MDAQQQARLAQQQEGQDVKPLPQQLQALGGSQAPPQQLSAAQQVILRDFWHGQMAEVERVPPDPAGFKNQALPLARIKKVRSKPGSEQLVRHVPWPSCGVHSMALMRYE